MSSIEGTERLNPEVAACLARHGVAAGSAVVVACSGGPDSSALLDALCAVSGAAGAGRPLRIVCASLDHGIRSAPERDEEREAVEALARCCGVPLVKGAVAPGLLAARARESGASLEDLARRERYRFLEAAARETGAAYIALGHTADDVAETVLMRAMQGVDVSGLAGIPERRGKLIRPLLHVSRAEVLSYLGARGIPWVVDASNADPRYLRNRVRAELVPAVSRVFPAYRRSLLELARKARETGRFIEAEAARRIPWESCRRGMRARWRDFEAADGVLRVSATYAAFDRLGAGRIPYRFVEAVARPLDAGKRGTIVAGCGFRLSRRGEWVWAEPDVVRRRKIGYLVRVRGPGSYALAELAMEVSVALSGTLSGAGVSLGERGLVVRSRRPGDRVRVGEQWVTLERLEAWQREALARRGDVRRIEARWDLVPVVAGRGGIAAVLGSAVGGVDSWAEGSRNALGDAAISVAVTVEEQ
jgi:tRNA(Ile)-lysidine synthetase-like protein